MSGEDLEAELARFEAELATVQQPAAPSPAVSGGPARCQTPPGRLCCLLHSLTRLGRQQGRWRRAGEFGGRAGAPQPRPVRPRARKLCSLARAHRWHLLCCLSLQGPPPVLPPPRLPPPGGPPPRLPPPVLPPPGAAHGPPRLMQPPPGTLPPPMMGGPPPFG